MELKRIEKHESHSNNFVPNLDFLDAALVIYLIPLKEGPKNTLSPTNANRKSKWKACLSTIFSPSSPNRLAFETATRASDEKRAGQEKR